MNAPAEIIPFKAEGPQPLLREIAQAEAFPVEALGPLREAVEAVQDISQAPVAIAAQSALAVASLPVQGFSDVETLGGDAPCSLFCLTVAESGERKSRCDKPLMKALRDHERDGRATYSETSAEHDLKHKIWTEKRKRLVTDLAGDKKDKAAAAEADLRALGSEPKPPLHPNITAMDPTFEGLLKLYAMGRPALGLFSDDAGSFIGGHAMNADNRLKTMAGLSKLWDGAPIDRTRAGDVVVTYTGRRLAAHLMVQPVAALPLMADPEASGQGFLARFLVTDPTSHIGTRLQRGHDPASDTAVRLFGARLRTILETPMPTGQNPQELAPVRLPLSTTARELLWRFYQATETAQGARGTLEGVRAVASKSAEQACRIAGVLTLWTDLDAPEVTAQAMASGVTLAGYYLTEARRLADVGAVSAETDRAEMLRKWLLESWGHDDICPSEILQHGPPGLRERKALRGPLATLEKLGWIVRLPEGAEVRGVARKEAYRIVRPAHVL